MSLINKIKQVSIDVAQAFTPVLKESTFKLTGKLTPEEFVSKKFLCFIYHLFNYFRLLLAIISFGVVLHGVGQQVMKEKLKTFYQKKSNSL